MLPLTGLLNPLATPHHMGQDDDAEYREGVVLDKPVKDGKGSYVNVGLGEEIQIDKRLQAGCRVTVQMESEAPGRTLFHYHHHHSVFASFRESNA